MSARPTPKSPNPHGAMIQELLCASDTRPLQSAETRETRETSETSALVQNKANKHPETKRASKGQSVEKPPLRESYHSKLYAKRTANHMHDTVYVPGTYRLQKCTTYSVCTPYCICNRGIDTPHTHRQPSSCHTAHVTAMRNEERQRKTPLRTLPTPPSGPWPATAGTKRGSGGTGVRPQLVK